MFCYSSDQSEESSDTQVSVAERIFQMQNKIEGDTPPSSKSGSGSVTPSHALGFRSDTLSILFCLFNFTKTFSLFKVLYFIMAKFYNYTYLLVKYFKNTFYRIKLSKRIKSTCTLFLLFFHIYLIYLSSLSTYEHVQRFSAHAFCSRIRKTHF